MSTHRPAPSINPKTVYVEEGEFGESSKQSVGEIAATMLKSFHIDLDKGAVWLGDRRVLLLQAQWFLDLRKTLIDTLGRQGARAVLTQLGYAAGVRDAHLSMKLHPDFDILSLMASGGAFHALQGSARAVRRRVELDLSTKHCYLEFEWRNAIEDEKSSDGPSHHSPDNCWMEIGYSSGFLSTCIGGNIVVREVQCAANGALECVCVCVARFAHEWEDVSEDLKYLDPSRLPSQGGVHEPPPSAVSRNVTSTLPGAEPPDNRATESLIGRSGAFDAVVQQARRVGKTTATVLLLGESGVGKSAFARFIHDYSDRAAKPFIEVNCAAIPDALLESELFGVERGAFTGATSSRTGRFEEAYGGTLFLDEVGLLPPAAQGKLLRVLQSQKYERLGSNKTHLADVRLVAATNNDLGAAVREGSFRSDLFYRLNVFPITLPPLRSRLGDLPLLIDHLVGSFCQRYGRSPKGITPEAYRAMLHHDWPGNIRELENVIERAVILVNEGEAIDVHHLFTSDADFRATGLRWLDDGGKLMGPPSDTSTDPDYSAQADLPAKNWFEVAIHQPRHSLEEIEQAVVLAALRTFDGSLIKAAQHLGVTRAQIDYRIKKWGVDPRLLGD